MSLLEKIDKNNLPSHVAVIMDGNGRWAKKTGSCFPIFFIFLKFFGYEFRTNNFRVGIVLALPLGA